jgi:hypothetical protein
MHIILIVVGWKYVILLYDIKNIKGTWLLLIKNIQKEHAYEES